MTEFILTRPDGKPIKSIDDWTRPLTDDHWKPGRSAMELAFFWLRSGSLAPPQEYIDLLSSEPRLNNLKLIRGIPEWVTGLPERGKGRNHDLWLIGSTLSESITICVEAKADEPFSNHTISSYRDYALERRNKGIPTRVPERIHSLLEIIDQPFSKWASIRFQLLTAICGTVIQAKHDRSSVAVLIIHEFETHLTKKKYIKRNQADYENFLSVLETNKPLENTNILHGPFRVFDEDFYVGKIFTSLL